MSLRLIGITSLLLLTPPLSAQLSPSVPRIPKDINDQGGHNSFPEELGLIGDKVYFIPPDNPDFALELVDLNADRDERVIQVSTDNQWPDNLAERDTPIFFAATSSAHGRELWKTDGTFAGTTLVKDTSLGDGDPKWITVAGDSVYFTANDGPSGYELWKSDGTEAGTFRVKDIVPGFGDSNPTELCAIGSNVVFVIQDEEVGPQLWGSDGTEDGTFPIFDAPIEPLRGFGSSHLAQTNQLVYFLGPHLESNSQLWFTDGTLGGTRPFSEIHPGLSHFERFRHRPGASELYFISNDNIWQTSDTPESAAIIYESVGWISDYSVNSQGIFFLGWTQLNFLPNGTDQLTHLYEFPVDDESIFVSGLTPIGNRVFAKGDLYDGEAENLIVSDGTIEGTGTAIYRDYFSQLASNNDRAWFVGAPDWPDYETCLFVVDGVTGETLTLFETQDSISIRSVIEIGAGVLFRFLGLSGDYWYSDGTVEGSSPLPQRGGTGSSYPDEITAGDQGQVYFSASSPQYGRELWKSDGSTAETILIRDLSPGPGDSSPENLAASGSRIYFTAETETHGRELWKSDGTEAGTTLVADLTPGVESSDFLHLIVTDSWTYAVTRTDLGEGRDYDFKLWRTDGTQASTTCLLTYTAKWYNPPSGFTPTENGLVFSGSSPSGSGLLIVDDNTGEITLLSSTQPKNNLIKQNGRLYFPSGDDLWISDGTPEGTGVLMMDIGDRIRNIYGLPDLSSLLLYDSDKHRFKRFDSISGNLDDFGKPSIFDYSVDFGRSTIVRNSLFFLNEYPYRNALFISDGTIEGTLEVTSVNDLATAEISSVGSNLYLARESHIEAPFAPNQLWKLPANSPEEDPKLVNNSDGNSIVTPSKVVVTGNRAFLSGGHHLYGDELYSFEVGISLDPTAQISADSATITGKIDPRESPSSAILEYGTTSEFGSTLPITLPPPGSTEWTDFSAEISNLLPSTTYYYRVSTSNEFNTFTSSTQSFTSPNAAPVFWGWTLNTSLENPASISVSTLLTNTFDHEGHSIDLAIISPSSSQGGQVTLVDGNIIYTPPLGYSGADSFLITFTDELGASSDASIQVYIHPPPGQDTPSGHTLTLNHSPTGSSIVHFTGLPGRIYQVQRSTDLKTWTTIATLIADGNGVIQFEDLDPAQTTLFYRIAR